MYSVNVNVAICWNYPRMNQSKIENIVENIVFDD